MMFRSLQQHARRVLAHRSNAARLFCSNANATLSSSNQTLQSRIDSALHQNSKISTVLEKWTQQGNKLNPSLVRRIFEKLRESKQYPQALAVSTWMAERKICSLVPEDYTTRFHLTENVLGFKEAEKFLEKVPEILRNESMYTALLNRYTESEKKDLDGAEAVFKKMRELGLLSKPSSYNPMVSLYISLGNQGKVDEILREMKENNVELDTPTVAKAYLRVGSKREAREMLLRAEEVNDPASYEELMRLYGEAGGKSEDVYRIWNLYKKLGKQDSEGYVALIGSLLNLDDTKGAEEMYYKEYECSGLEFDVRIPTTLVSGFRKKGMVKQADILMNKTLRNIRSGNKPITPLLEEWGKLGTQVKPSELRDLIKNLQDSNHFSKALEASSWLCSQKVINLYPEDYADRLDLTEKVFGLKEAYKFFDASIPETMKGYSVYTTLLKIYTRSDHQDVGNAEAIFEKMGELGFLSKPSPFKSMISIYSVLGKRVEIDNLLRKMKEKNIELDSVTMYNVLRVRNKTGEMGSEEYISVVKSLLKLGDVQEAQKMYGEWEQSSGGTESYASEEGGEMIGENIKRFMQNILGGVVVFCLVTPPLLILLYTAATDPQLVVSFVLLCLVASACPYLLIIISPLVLIVPTESQ